MNPEKDKFYTLITGASGGIGLAMARVFAEHGHPLILVARSADKLQALEKELEERYGIPVEVLVKDLARPAAPKELYIQVLEQRWEVDILVNNAGIGNYGYFAKTDMKKESDLIQINIAALTELTKLFLGSMLNRKSGKILNVASTAAFQPGPVMSVYYASKAYVLSFSEAIANELKGSGVSVSCLCPGPTESDFHERAEMNMKKNYFFKPWIRMSAEAVAKKAYRGLMRGKRVVLPGIFNKITPLGMRLFPRAFVTQIVRDVQDVRFMGN